ncbi:hypothetical protein SO802_024489 [Lithocarpus litseifolius]|uniref:Transposase-associated domain-containing protein n=1 Tax=Lithocarpus litseifolius TaxID=425828 RepID=A0AAW2C8Z6_9ROSI
MDRSWMKLTNIRSREYLDGVQQFLNFASNHAHLDGTISCSCRKCVHTNSWPIDVVQAHLVSKGICRGYNPWVFNEESSSAQTSFEIPNSHVQENLIECADLRDMLHDMFPIQDMAFGLMEEVLIVQQPTKGPAEGPNEDALQFMKLLEELINLVMKKENANLESCPNYNRSRWESNESKETTNHMKWHANSRVNEGLLRHHVDSETWKSFDSKYIEFSSEPRNVRLGLAVDGFNPYGNMSSTHSTWHVNLIPYNLPLWMCMKRSSFLLSLLIPGPTSPGNDIDVYLQPLVEELKELWDVGVKTFDVSSKKSF